MSDQDVISAKGFSKSISFSFKKDGGYSWSRLNAIERRRRSALKKSHLPFFAILTSFDGTILSTIIEDPLTYITMCCYCGVRFGAYYGLPSQISDIADAANVDVIGGFLSFFLVMFLGFNNDRFSALYNHSMAIEQRIFNCTSVAHTTLPRARALRINRYLNAAHIAGYVGLSDTYTYQNFFLPINEKYHILNDNEVARMKAIDMNDKNGTAYRELCSWVLADVTDAGNEQLIDETIAEMLRQNTMDLRSAIDELFDAQDQPVVFFYVHFICLLCVFYLPLFAIQSGLKGGSSDDAYWLTDVIAGLVVMVQVLFVTGLRTLAHKMMDPYQDDLEDFSVIHYVTFTWTQSRKLLEAELREPVDESAEEEHARLSKPVVVAKEKSTRSI